MKISMTGTRYSLAVVLLAVMSACSHGTMRGSVAMKASDDEAHVCLGENEVKAGDRVALFKNVCTTPRIAHRICEKKRLGEGTVERVLDRHYSVVKMDPGVPFEEGTIVEKE